VVKISSVLDTDDGSRDETPSYTVNDIIPSSRYDFEERVSATDRGEPGYRPEGIKPRLTGDSYSNCVTD